MIERNIKIDNLTVKEMANEIREMDSQKQIELINELGKITKAWRSGIGLDIQLSYIKDDIDKYINSDGIYFINKIKEWVGDYFNKIKTTFYHV